MAGITGSMTVGDLVVVRPGAARVLRQHQIDFCCGGQRTLAEACQERGLHLDVLIAQLTDDAPPADDDAAPQGMSTKELIGHIVERHHRYLRRALPSVQQMASTVARVHGAHNPNLSQLDSQLNTLGDSLLSHLDTEEEVLFPLLLARSADPVARSVELEMMLGEHRAVGTALERIRVLTDNFTLPDWACATYRALFAELESMEADIHQHVHLENNVLMPRFPAPPVSHS